MADSNLLEHVFIFAVKLRIFGRQLGSYLAINATEVELVPTRIGTNGRKGNARMNVSLPHLFESLLLTNECSRIGCLKSNSLRKKVFTQ